MDWIVRWRLHRKVSMVDYKRPKFQNQGRDIWRTPRKVGYQLKKHFVCLPWPKVPLISFHTSTDSKKNTSALQKGIIAQMFDLCYVIIIPVDRKGNEETSLHDKPRVNQHQVNFQSLICFNYANLDWSEKYLPLCNNTNNSVARFTK